jgi:hypothetical protein
MSQARTDRKFTQIIDRIEEQPGTDLNRDLLKVALTAVDVASVDQNITEIGGQAQSAVDVANQIDRIEAALASSGGDQLRVDLENYNGNNLPTTLEANNAGTLQVEQQSPVGIEDSTGSQVDPLDTGDQPLDVSGAEVDVDIATQTLSPLTVTDDGALGIASYSGGALPTEQQTPVGVEDSAGTQVDPALATDYPDTQVSGEDIIANGNLVIGPVPVARSSGVTIAANSTDGNTFSVSVDWVDSSGNIYQEESSTDIQLSAITQDFARLVRKAPQVRVTVTDDSGATQNNINIHVDTQR